MSETERHSMTEWPNGSAVFEHGHAKGVIGAKPEKRPGFLGRTVHEAEAWRAWRWNAGAYVDLGTFPDFLQAMDALAPSKADGRRSSRKGQDAASKPQAKKAERSKAGSASSHRRPSRHPGRSAAKGAPA